MERPPPGCRRSRRAYSSGVAAKGVLEDFARRREENGMSLACTQAPQPYEPAPKNIPENRAGCFGHLYVAGGSRARAFQKPLWRLIPRPHLGSAVPALGAPRVAGNVADPHYRVPVQSLLPSSSSSSLTPCSLLILLLLFDLFHLLRPLHFLLFFSSSSRPPTFYLLSICLLIYDILSIYLLSIVATIY